MLIYGASSNHQVTITNDKEYDIFLTPTLYKYYPQTEFILNLEPFEEIVRITNDYITIPSNSQKDINFQIIAPENLDLGTFYNLIVFTQSNQSQDQQSTIGASGSLSHLVRLHITQKSEQDIVTENWDVNLEVVNRGIPFFRASTIKVTVFNNSKYTLTPKGEIQVVKRRGNKEPEYIKVNMDRKRLFPEQTFEQEYEVTSWYLEDIFFGKTAYLKIENGLDKNVLSEEIKIAGFTNEFLYILGTITVVIILAFSIKKDTKPEPEFSE